MRIGFFGAGNISSAMALGISTQFKNIDLFFYSPSGVSSKSLANNVNGTFVEKIELMPKDLDWYILAFKPQNLSEFNFEFKDNAKILSTLAGTSYETLKLKFNKTKIARIMPNTPTRIMKGMNILFFGDGFDLLSKYELKEIFHSCGEVVVVENENALDLITPFSGSGPGIILELATYFENALLDLKIENIDTKKIVAETFLGTALLMSKEAKSFEELRDQVVSKKGVTSAALESIRSNHLEDSIKAAFKSAINRIEEMKKGI